MWNYEKRLEYPVNITTPNAKIAQIILSQYGGPNCSNRWIKMEGKQLTLPPVLRYVASSLHPLSSTELAFPYNKLNEYINPSFDLFILG